MFFSFYWLTLMIRCSDRWCSYFLVLANLAISLISDFQCHYFLNDILFMADNYQCIYFLDELRVFAVLIRSVFVIRQSGFVGWLFSSWLSGLGRLDLFFTDHLYSTFILTNLAIQEALHTVILCSFPVTKKTNQSTCKMSGT